MTYQQASARVLDRIRLNNRRRNHLVANPDDAEFERSDERDDELAAEQAAGDAAVNEMVEVEALANPDLGPQATPTPGAGRRCCTPRRRGR